MPWVQPYLGRKSLLPHINGESSVPGTERWRLSLDFRVQAESCSSGADEANKGRRKGWLFVGQFQASHDHSHDKWWFFLGIWNRIWDMNGPCTSWPVIQHGESPPTSMIFCRHLHSWWGFPATFDDTGGYLAFRGLLNSLDEIQSFFADFRGDVGAVADGYRSRLWGNQELIKKCTQNWSSGGSKILTHTLVFRMWESR